MVLSVEANGEYLRVAFIRNDGQPAVGEYKRVGWSIPPREIAEQFEAVLRRPPLVVHRRRGRNAPPER